MCGRFCLAFWQSRPSGQECQGNCAVLAHSSLILLQPVLCMSSALFPSLRAFPYTCCFRVQQEGFALVRLRIIYPISVLSPFGPAVTDYSHPPRALICPLLFLHSASAFVSGLFERPWSPPFTSPSLPPIPRLCSLFPWATCQRINFLLPARVSVSPLYSASAFVYWLFEGTGCLGPAQYFSLYRHLLIMAYMTFSVPTSLYTQCVGVCVRAL